MYEEKQNSSKQVLLSVLAVAVLVVAVVGVSFAFFNYSKQGEKENVIETGSLVFNYNEKTNGIQLTNALPVADTAVDSKLTGETDKFDFTVDAKISGDVTIDYDIVLLETTNPADNETLDSKYVKVKLKKGSDISTYSTDIKEASFFDALDESDSLKADQSSTYAAKKLYSSSISSTDTHYYRFYMWLSEKVYDGSSNDKDTMMTNDVCQKQGGAEEVACDDAQYGLEGSETQATVKTKGTNGKTFKVKVAVTAKDQAGA